MKLDWSALENIELSNWLLPSNKVFPFSVVIHGNEDQPNSEALTLAKTIMVYFDMFTGSARVQLHALINPKIVEDGIIADSFYFDEYANSFRIHFNLEGDSSAHWKIRFVRQGGMHLTDYIALEIPTPELERTASRPSNSLL